MNYFDDTRKREFNSKMAEMYSMILGVDSDEFKTQLSNSFKLDYIDLLVLKLLEDAGFDMNNIGTYLFGFVAKDKYMQILGINGSGISREIRAQGCEMLVQLGYNSIISSARKIFGQYNLTSPIKLIKSEIDIEYFKKSLNDAIKLSYYGAEGILKYDNELFISFIRDIRNKKSSFAAFNAEHLTRGRKPRY